MQDFDHVALLARETVQAGHSVLVFCGTKAACEHTAKRAARWVEKAADGGRWHRSCRLWGLLCGCCSRLC